MLKQYKAAELIKMIILGLGIISSVFIILNKENYHIDEVSSFILSNCIDSTGLVSQDGIKYNNTESPWITGMAATGQSRFNLENVWQNQKNDTHPPLYYILLNFICSIFPGQISRWFPGIINIAFFVLAAFFIFKLSQCLIADRFSDHVILAYAVFCYGMIQMNSFFRMYIMAMAWIVLFTYFNIRALIKRKMDISYYFSIMMVVFLGALTHYYVIIFAVFQSLAMVIVLCRLKMIKELFSYILAVLFAGMHAVLLFPYMFYHIFTGGTRGKQAFQNFATEGIERIISFWKILNDQIAGGLLFFVLGYILIAFIIMGIRRVRKKERQSTKPPERQISFWSWFLLIFPVILYLLVVSKSAAYITDRYIYPAYGLLVVILTGGICLTTQSLFRNYNKIQKGIILMMTGILLFMGYRNADWEFLYHSEQSETALANAEKYKDFSCIYFYAEKWECKASYLEAIKYVDITFYPVSRMGEIKDITEPTVIYVPREQSEEYIQQVMKQNPKLTEYEIISRFSGYETGYMVE